MAVVTVNIYILANNNFVFLANILIYFVFLAKYNKINIAKKRYGKREGHRKSV